MEREREFMYTKADIQEISLSLVSTAVCLHSQLQNTEQLRRRK